MHVKALPFNFCLADESIQGFYLHTFTFSCWREHARFLLANFHFFPVDERMQGFYLHTFTFFLLKRACKAFACTLSLFFLLMRVCKAFTCTLSLFAWKFSQHSLPRQDAGRSPQEKFEQSTFVQLLSCTLTDPADLTNWGQERKQKSYLLRK